MSIYESIKAYSPNMAGVWLLMRYKYEMYKRTKEPKALQENEYKTYLEKFYKIKTGHVLNLDKPDRFTEKIQWRKLNDQNEIYSLLSDKYRVREWVKGKIGDQFLVPMIGHWECFDEIDFNILPNKFVLKANNGCHSNLIVTDKEEFIRGKWAAKRTMNYWLHSPSYYEGLELHYRKIPPVILAEQYLEPQEGEKCLTDYKFHCFNGKPFVCQVIRGRTTRETLDFYDKKWNHLPIAHPAYPNSEGLTEKPHNYELMLEIAATLSNGFQYVRVDLYSTDKVYFGEMTFTPASGTERYIPDEWDYQMGNQWNIYIEQVNYPVVMGMTKNNLF